MLGLWVGFLFLVVLRRWSLPIKARVIYNVSRCLPCCLVILHSPWNQAGDCHLSLSFSFINHLVYDSKLFSALIIDLGGYILCGHIIWWYESHVTIRKRCFASNSHKTWRRIYRCQGCSHPINWSGWMLSRKLHWMNTLWLHAWHPVSTRDQVCMHVWPRQPTLNFDYMF